MKTIVFSFSIIIVDFSKIKNSSDVECSAVTADEGAAHRRSRCLHQEASAVLGETEDFRRGGETGAGQAPVVQGETAALSRGAESREQEDEQAKPGETTELRREDEMQAGEG